MLTSIIRDLLCIFSHSTHAYIRVSIIRGFTDVQVHTDLLTGCCGEVYCLTGSSISPPVVLRFCKLHQNNIIHLYIIFEKGLMHITHVHGGELASHKRSLTHRPSSPGH